eukprot:3394507-Pleurochrysis_carterae.AAC.1
MSPPYQSKARISTHTSAQPRAMLAAKGPAKARNLTYYNIVEHTRRMHAMQGFQRPKFEYSYGIRRPLFAKSLHSRPPKALTWWLCCSHSYPCTLGQSNLW